VAREIIAKMLTDHLLIKRSKTDPFCNFVFPPSDHLSCADLLRYHHCTCLSSISTGGPSSEPNSNRLTRMSVTFYSQTGASIMCRYTLEPNKTARNLMPSPTHGPGVGWERGRLARRRNLPVGRCRWALHGTGTNDGQAL
jgi:hypothetical protein